MKTVWTHRALRALTNIHQHIAADNLNAADLLKDRALEFVETKLAAHPLVGRPGRVAGTRESVVHQNYIIVYRVTENVIEILTVRHAARLWPDKL
jgi:toxin ParE1/3/4